MKHPLLAAVTEAPETGGLLFTGRISLALQPWLADHAIGGHVLVPGTALVDVAVQAADHTDHPVLDELVIEAPILLADNTVLRLQVTVGEPDETGRRPVGIHSCPEDREHEWTRHATGFLHPGGRRP